MKKRRKYIAQNQLKCKGEKELLQYANGFSCAMDPEKGELIIKFLQQCPDFDEENNNVSVEEISTIVMGRVTAQKLLDGLSEMLE